MWNITPPCQPLLQSAPAVTLPQPLPPPLTPLPLIQPPAPGPQPPSVPVVGVVLHSNDSAPWQAIINDFKEESCCHLFCASSSDAHQVYLPVWGMQKFQHVLWGKGGMNNNDPWPRQWGVSPAKMTTPHCNEDDKHNHKKTSELGLDLIFDHILSTNNLLYIL